jgi:hypothetical protein
VTDAGRDLLTSLHTAIRSVLSTKRRWAVFVTKQETSSGGTRHRVPFTEQPARAFSFQIANGSASVGFG